MLTKIVTKALAARLKKALLFLISPVQTTKVDGRFIGESGRLIADNTWNNKFRRHEGLLIMDSLSKANWKEILSVS